MLNILFVDADSKNDFPNLALMKLSAWMKEINNGNITIDLVKGIPTTAPLFPYDKVYVSCIFYQNKSAVEAYVKQFAPLEIMIGGSGWDLKAKLVQPIEHIMPDYSLYGIDYSLGFTSRGCIRNCGFCIVPEKEGPMRNNAPISEFHNPDHKKVMLLDNNFLASPRWTQNLDYIIEHNLKVNFNQGLDIRLIDWHKAAYLAKTNYRTWSFKTKSLHFAFDNPKHEDIIRKKVNILVEAGIKPKHLMFYILVGYNSTLKQDLKRVEILKELGCIPYIMKYNQSQSPDLKKLARWVNRRYHEFISFEEFDNTM